MGPRLVHVSKMLAWALRHRPQELGLALDPAGWVAVDDLLRGLATRGDPVSLEELREVVRANDKQRFAISEDGLRIRAQQGHSVAVDLAYPPATPPEVLFHGTVARYLPSIRAGGLVRGQRHDVHLSETAEAARAVGARRGRPVVLRVRAAAMAAAGHLFRRTPNGVWLTDGVPPEFLDIPV